MADNSYPLFAEATGSAPQSSAPDLYADVVGQRLSPSARKAQIGQLTDQFWAAEAKGDEAGKTQAFKQIRALGGTLYGPTAAQTQADMMGAHNPTKDMNWFQKGLAGVGKSFVDTGRGIGELIGTETPQQVAASRAQDAPLMATGAGKVGNALGYLAQSVPLIAAAPESLAAGTLGKLGVMAATGAAQGYLSPYTSGNEHALNTGLGAAAGPALFGAGRAVKNTLTGFATPEARKLLAEGVKLTPGQMLGGTLKKWEDAGTSMPFVGNIVDSAKDKALDSFNRTTINKALQQIGAKVPDTVKTGHEALTFANKAASAAYDQALDKTRGQFDAGLVQGMGKIISTSDPEVRGELSNVLKRDVFPKLTQNNGQITGRQFKDMLSDLGNVRATYGRSESSTNRATGKAIGDLMDQLDGMFQRVNGPDKMAQLDKADATWRQFKNLQAATVSAGRRRGGVFTPGDVLDAVKKGDVSKDKAAFARGELPMQNYANNAQDVFPSSWNDSGTTPRRNYFNPFALGTGAALAVPAQAAYSGVARNMLARALAPTPSPVRNYLANLAAQRFPQLGTSAVMGANRVMLPFSVPPVPPNLIAPPATGQQ